MGVNNYAYPDAVPSGLFRPLVRKTLVCADVGFIPGEGIFSMAKKLYVGNLSYNTTEDSLRNLFSGFGSVASAKIIFDRETGNSKGFGFIEMSTDEEASAAIAGTNGREFEGRQIRVNEAMDKPHQDRGPRGGYSNW
jgi:RNA recognition motif-containing protein